MERNANFKSKTRYKKRFSVWVVLRAFSFEVSKKCKNGRKNVLSHFSWGNFKKSKNLITANLKNYRTKTLTVSNKSRKTPSVIHFSVNFSMFPTDLNSAKIPSFDSISWFKHKTLFCSLWHFLIKLKLNAQETAQKSQISKFENVQHSPKPDYITVFI